MPSSGSAYVYTTSGTTSTTSTNTDTYYYYTSDSTCDTPYPIYRISYSGSVWYTGEIKEEKPKGDNEIIRD